MPAMNAMMAVISTAIITVLTVSKLIRFTLLSPFFLVFVFVTCATNSSVAFAIVLLCSNQRPAVGFSVEVSLLSLEWISHSTLFDAQPLTADLLMFLCYL